VTKVNIAIIGTGYVGLVSGTSFADMGNTVVCIDNNQEKLLKLRKGELPIFEPGLETIFNKNVRNSRLSFSNDLKSAVEHAEVIFLCLPTPQDEDGSADLSYVLSVADKIGSILCEHKIQGHKIIVNKSTVPVGTAKKVKEKIKKWGIHNFSVVSNPEFLREGFAVEDFLKPERIVIGTDRDYAFQKMASLYEPFVRQGNPILRMDNESAEVTKYAANSYLAMRISYMNELANFCESVNADIDSVRKGMSTDSRIGKRFLFPGIGYGGSCFPKDVNALAKTAQEHGHEMELIKSTNKVNYKQKLVIVNKIINHYGVNLSGLKFAVWGLAFKPNTDDMRESPSIVIINKLLEAGAQVSAFDPAAKETAKYHFGDSITIVDNQYEAVKNSDALLILTEWNEFRNPDFKQIKTQLKAPMIFDGRNIFSVNKMEDYGFTYWSIGRKSLSGRNNVEEKIENWDRYLKISA
jgi:UDPglucose 6-dehydrogenase